MRGDQLADLGELTLRCKSEQARKYIEEAVGCYQAGAFRAAIVATWIAVVFDFLDKLHQLELSGDGNDRARLEAFEEIRRSQDVGRSLKFERSVLGMARDEFDLISDQEYEDLGRLLQDRNRCAHPSMNSADEVYQPTAELARYHLRSAVTHLLQHLPVQGKAAIERLVSEVSSQYFPTSTEQAVTHFRNGPLARPRESLVRNFVVMLLKAILLDNLKARAIRQHAAALNAVLQMHRELAEGTLREKASDIMRRVDDLWIERLVWLLAYCPDLWEFTAEDVRARATAYVVTMPDLDLWPTLGLALTSERLREQARTRLASVKPDMLMTLLDSDAAEAIGLAVDRPEFVARAVDAYLDAYSYASANERAVKLVLPLADLLDRQQIERIVEGAAQNSQIRESTQWRNVMSSFRKAGRMPEDDFDKLLARNGIT